jgi:hypothetical protein
MKARIDMRAVIAAAFLLLLVLLLPAVPAGAAATGVEGRVVDATADRGVGDLQVTLHVYDQGGETGTTSAATDADGRFSLPAP